MLEILKENYQWIFSGIGVSFILFILNKFSLKRKGDKTIYDNRLVINNFNNDSEIENEYSNKNTKILFIDDEHTNFKMVSILKKAGWKNTKSIKDITDLDDYRAQEANIIFVDINGVGTTLFKDQGLGLASALKKRYPFKTIVIYSDQTTGDRFHSALREVDDVLPKNAEPYQFINLIESHT